MTCGRGPPPEAGRGVVPLRAPAGGGTWARHGLCGGSPGRRADSGLGVGEPDVDRRIDPVHRPLADALALHEIRLADMVAVANSHLHFDHCGQNARFAGLPIYVQAAEYRAAHEPDYTVPGWVDFPGATYELLDGEAEVFPGVRLLPTPGHTPGHQSLVVETEQGRVIIAGQAVYTAAEWEGSTDPRRSGEGSAWSAELYADSVRRLRGLDSLRVLFSHDEVVWERA